MTDRGACVAFLPDVLRALMAAEPLASVAALTPPPAVPALQFEGRQRAELPRPARTRT